MSLSAYVHIPFCTHKCDFCDFAAFAGLGHLEEDYCQIVSKEIDERTKILNNARQLSSIFYGGGTPGLISVSNLGKIHQRLIDRLGVEDSCEVSLETTPHAITSEKVTGWLELGVNRLSIGIESLQDSELKAIGRDHTAEQALTGVAMAIENGCENVSIDLMYALPTQTDASWKDTLDQVFELAARHKEIRHLSAYSLHLAKDLPLFSRFPKDSDCYPDEESFENMFVLLLEMSKKSGFEHYEVSNFCKPGHQSRHNLSYWNSSEYLAFGVSAHRYVDGVRSSNWRSLATYMKDYMGSETTEPLDEATKMKEAIMLGLRLRKGLDLAEFERTFGVDLLVKLDQPIKKLASGGFLEVTKDCLRITDKGVLVSNSIIAELF